MDNSPIVINFFAGPSCGKSTMVGGIFNVDILKHNQLYIFTKQYAQNGKD